MFIVGRGRHDAPTAGLRFGQDANAKYWFRRVGRHPVFESLHHQAARIAQAPESIVQRQAWDPFAFVDLCEEASRGDEVQQLEWRLLLAFATGERALTTRRSARKSKRRRHAVPGPSIQ